MAKFKKGDFIRYSDEYVSGIGSVVHDEINCDSVLVAVEVKDRHRAYYEDGTCRYFSSDDLEPLPVAAEAQPAAPAPLRIVAGRYYMTRDGRKAGPMRVEGYYIFGDVLGGPIGKAYQPDGKHGNKHIENDPRFDLVAEWPADTVTNVAATVDAISEEYGPVAPTAKFKVGDRVRCIDGLGFAKVKSVRADGRYMVDWDDGDVGRQWWGDGDFKIVDRESLSIVCKLSNGQPLPAIRPRVHASMDEANEEAKRLASANSGQEFGVFTLVETHKVEKTYEHEWQRLAAGGNKIASIKELRAANSFLSLRSAKLFIEDFIDAA